MRIRVAYAELRTYPDNSNKAAEAEIEAVIPEGKDADKAFNQLWGMVQKEVKERLEVKDKGETIREGEK